MSASTGDAAPAVTAVVPADQAMGVETDAAITVNFSESVSLSAQAIILQCPVSTTIPLTGLPAIGVSTVTVRPTIPLPPTTLCTVTVVAEEVVDQNGNRLVNPFRFSFTTGQTDKTLTVALNPIGGGNITGNGINCPNDCTEAYPGGTTVNVLATPNIGWGFTGWSGDCTNTTPTCTVTLSDNRTVTANFATLYTLHVAKTGNGTITSAPAGIHCGADCSETYLSGTAVTLSVTPTAGWVFSGWSGACTGTGPCSVTMNADRAVTATFTAAYTLTVNKVGNGTVTSTPMGIECGTDCTETYADGTNVSLVATPDSGWLFSSWSGACTGTSSCTVDLAGHRTVNATFTQLHTLTVAKTGNGTVTSTPVGIDCGADCTEAYSTGTSVTLTATPDTGWTFAGWGGSCSGTGACVVTLTTARTVTATFNPPPMLTVTRTGNGTITSVPAGITCGNDCTEAYARGTSVTLTATPDVGSAFTGWTGACTGTGSCTVTMTEARTVSATFTPAYLLTLNRTGDGQVTSTPPGINCGTDCSESYSNGTRISLVATPDTGWLFSGWGGDCQGTAGCALTLSANRTVTATFIEATSPTDTDNDGMPDAVELQQNTNPNVKDNDLFNNARLFAMQQYRDFLQREGDPAGIHFWQNQLQNGASRRVDMIDGFLRSAEFGEVITPVARLYFAYFRRIPDYDGLTFWVNAFKNGESLISISQAFAESAEFRNAYGNLDNRNFVSTIYQNVYGRSADAGGLNYWTGLLDQNVVNRGAVMVEFSKAAEYQTIIEPSVTVTMVYMGMLKRAPDQGGFDYWVSLLRSGQTPLNLIEGFLSATEYYNRFLPTR